jgi:cysteine synthase
MHSWPRWGWGERTRESVGSFASGTPRCAILAPRRWGPHGIEGIGDGFVPGDLDPFILTGVITASAGEAIEAARRHSQTEGIFCGISSGCNVAAAGKLSKRHPEIGRIVVMINDAGQRYFSAPPCESGTRGGTEERASPGPALCERAGQASVAI